MSNTNNIEFPCSGKPDDPTVQSLLGIYDQKQEGLQVQRIKVPRGELTARQLSAIAELTLEHAPGYPLHITTRQDIQLHGLHPESLSEVQQGLNDVGLTTVGACGDSLRNITTSPVNGMVAGTFNVSEVAQAIRTAGESLPFIRNMPRKFKISISCCAEHSARPWINDMGLIAQDDDTFRVIGAGSLGHRPVTGIELYGSVNCSDIVPLVVAALRFFNAEGNREKRYSARWRHVRERMGDDRFLDRLDELFQKELREGDWPVPSMPTVQEDVSNQLHLQLPYGLLKAKTATDLARTTDAADGLIRLGLEHDLYAFAPAELELTPELKSLTSGPSIVSCPGTTWCPLGISHSRGVEAELREIWPDGAEELLLGFSGCPNNCAHAAVADIGLTGTKKKVDGERDQCFRLLAGGGLGQSPELGQELHAAVPQSAAASVIHWLVNQYTDSPCGSMNEFVEKNFDGLQNGVEQFINQ